MSASKSSFTQMVSFRLLAIVLSFAIGIGLSELLAQQYYSFKVQPFLDQQKNSPLHYFTSSDDQGLVYILRPGTHIETEGRILNINKHGIRSNSDVISDRKKIALLGDSVVFSIGLSQEYSLDQELQRQLGDKVEVLNFAVPGYGVNEIASFMRQKATIYNPNKYIYVMNLNDFSLRDTIYEGADNGLYRIYRSPHWKLPFFARKAVYYLSCKGFDWTSVAWYKCLYKGGASTGILKVAQMADYADKMGAKFSVVIFPPRIAYRNGAFELKDIVDEACSELNKRNIPCSSPVTQFGENPNLYQDYTDHLTPEGTAMFASVLKPLAEF